MDSEDLVSITKNLYVMLTLIVTAMLSPAPDVPPQRPIEPIVIYNKEATLPEETTIQGEQTANEESDEKEAKLSPTKNKKKHHFYQLGLRKFKAFVASGFNRRGVRNH